MPASDSANSSGSKGKKQQVLSSTRQQRLARSLARLQNFRYQMSRLVLFVASFFIIAYLIICRRKSGYVLSMAVSDGCLFFQLAMPVRPLGYLCRLLLLYHACHLLYLLIACVTTGLRGSPNAAMCNAVDDVLVCAHLGTVSVWMPRKFFEAGYEEVDALREDMLGLATRRVE